MALNETLWSQRNALDEAQSVMAFKSALEKFLAKKPHWPCLELSFNYRF